MKRIYDAKKKYKEIEIPQELSSRVSMAIEQSKPKKKGTGFYVKVFAGPVAVCAAICIAIGLGAMPGNVPVEVAGDEELLSLARAIPTEDSGAKTEAAAMPKSRAINRDFEMLSDKAENLLPIDEPVEMEFMSGVGAWGTKLVLNPDGTFTGEFSDADMGDMGEGYPDGTMYICSFDGRFDDIEKKNDYTYSMKLKSLEYDKGEPEEYIKDGIRYVKSVPYGVADGEEFVFYLPDAPASVLTEEEWLWWLGRLQDPVPETLTFYGLINKTTANGFFSYDLEVK